VEMERANPVMIVPPGKILVLNSHGPYLLDTRKWPVLKERSKLVVEHEIS
jgi:hypothetical protein